MNKRWAILLILIAGAALWFTTFALIDLWGYLRLKQHAPAHIQEWAVEGSGSKFFIKAAYSFESKNRKYEGACVLKEPQFLNKIAAETELKRWEQCAWSVWYDPSAPHFSSLQKLFPYKRVFNAAVCLALLGYFSFLYHQQAFSSRSLKKI